MATSGIPDESAGNCASGEAANAALFDAAYAELKKLAHRQLLNLSAPTLSTTALVHESYLRLAQSPCAVLEPRHFCSLAARAMRFVLVDHARERSAQKRDGGVRVTLDTQLPNGDDPGCEVLALDEALTRLAQLDLRLAQIVEWRYFGGMTELEIAEQLQVTERTVRRDWRKARAFLHRELESVQ